MDSDEIGKASCFRAGKLDTPRAADRDRTGIISLEG
jgi:hypothetical protein